MKQDQSRTGDQEHKGRVADHGEARKQVGPKKDGGI